MFKKLMLAATALSMVATPVVASAAPAPKGQTHTVVKEKRNGTVVVKKTTKVKPAPVRYRNWRKGERFDSRYARNYQVIDYHRYRGLKAPPRGYRYVRSGNDAVLVGITTGLIAAVIAGAIR